MRIPTIDAAKKICELSDWGVTNLQLQKLLYLAHMIYIGRNDSPLIDKDFQAWDYGAVIPELYKQFRIFGDKPICNVFGWNKVSLAHEQESFLKPAKKIKL